MAQASVAPSALTGQVTAPDWAVEVERAVQELLDTHPDPFTRITRSDFMDRVTRLRADLVDLDDRAVVIRTMRLFASIQDGHTRYDSENGSHGFDRLLPVVLHPFADGYHVVAATRDFGHLVGREVEGIGDYGIEEVVARILPLLSGDNRSGRERGLPHALQRLGLLRGVGVAPEAGGVSMLVGGDDGPTVVEVPTLHFEDPAFAAEAMVFMGDGVAGRSAVRSPWRLHWLKHPVPPAVTWAAIDDIGALHLTVRRIRDDADRAFADGIAEAFAEFDAQGLERLIVDVRANPGGNNMLLRPLIHGIIRRGLDGDGLFVVSDRGTFSAAVNLVTRLERELDPVLVGEAPAGSPNHFGDAEVFYHWETDLTAIVSSLRWQDSEPWDDRVRIDPDLPVLFSARAFAEGSDPALDAIRRYLSARATG